MSIDQKSHTKDRGEVRVPVPPPRAQAKAAQPPDSVLAKAPPPGTLRIEHRGGDRFDITIRDHVVTVDQPVSDGGEDLGPTPTELFVASLASCVGFYARRYLRRHRLDDSGLMVHASYQLATKPARVSGINLVVELTTPLPPKQREGLMAVARHCTVGNSLTDQPDVTSSLT